jgi:RecA-family ATPase
MSKFSAIEERAAKGREYLDEFAAAMQTKVPDFTAPEPISAPEWINARSTPDCIVKDYLFADVAVFIAAGGMGKTTLKLFEAIHIALGLPLYGLTIHKPGAVLIITAEDSREMLVARLREIAKAMELTDAQIAIVMQRVRISDVSGNGFKVTEVRGDVVKPSAGIDFIIEACQTIKPVLIVIDPAVSFGVGESRVNDAEQGLIEAARKLRNALNCCIQYIHHSGKQNAREKAVDQYAGRGGSAFADGARMVHVLQSLTPDEWRNETGIELSTGESGLRLARPKMSYCPPVGDILIRRNGYRFDHVERITTSNQAKLDMAANQVWQLLTFELSQCRYHSKNTLEALDTGLKRVEVRGAVDWLLASQRIESRDVPNAGKGGKRTYLHPIASPDKAANQAENTLENDESLTSEKTDFGSPPPIGNSLAANLPPPVEPFFSYASPDIDGEPMANLANQSAGMVEVEV